MITCLSLVQSVTRRSAQVPRRAINTSSINCVMRDAWLRRCRAASEMGSALHGAYCERCKHYRVTSLALAASSVIHSPAIAMAMVLWYREGERERENSTSLAFGFGLGFGDLVRDA
jgi:hypothetical protein